MSDPGLVAALLFAYALGVITTPALVGVWVWWKDLHAAVREGTPLVGEELERAKRRGDV